MHSNMPYRCYCCNDHMVVFWLIFANLLRLPLQMQLFNLHISNNTSKRAQDCNYWIYLLYRLNYCCLRVNLNNIQWFQRHIFFIWNLTYTTTYNVSHSIWLQIVQNINPQIIKCHYITPNSNSDFCVSNLPKHTFAPDNAQLTNKLRRWSCYF